MDIPYPPYKTYTESLPIFFDAQGYIPIFISSATLDFFKQRGFLSSIGFTHIIGEEAFMDKKKYVFDTAPDNDLYDKTLETIEQQTSPYLIVLQNISFHTPYNTPYGTTQKDALAYTDKSLYSFYLQLKKSGFFDNGILVIVSDHRKMEPLEDKEKEVLGEYWYTR
jgi:phosphoglycerol transferase MdoB-like AlkP superfamily enzyme